MKRMFPLFLSALLLTGLLASAQAAGEATVTLTITGGHETDPRDRGRPVVLIGNALGVTPEIFRDAFSHVKPAAAGTQRNREVCGLPDRGLASVTDREDMPSILENGDERPVNGP